MLPGVTTFIVCLVSIVDSVIFSLASAIGLLLKWVYVCLIPLCLRPLEHIICCMRLGKGCTETWQLYVPAVLGVVVVSLMQQGGLSVNE